MRVRFLTRRKFGEKEPVSVELDREIGDVEITGFSVDGKLVIRVSDAPADDWETIACVRVERRSSSGRPLRAVELALEKGEPTGGRSVYGISLSGLDGDEKPSYVIGSWPLPKAE